MEADQQAGPIDTSTSFMPMVGSNRTNCGTAIVRFLPTPSRHLDGRCVVCELVSRTIANSGESEQRDGSTPLGEDPHDDRDVSGASVVAGRSSTQTVALGGADGGVI